MHRWTFLFAILFVAFALAAVAVNSIVVHVVAAWFALDAAWLAVAYGFVGPRAFGKRADGSLPPWARIVFAPYIAVNHSVLRLVRLRGRAATFEEVIPGIVLGPRPVSADRRAFETANIRAVLDLTCEFDEARFIRGRHAYSAVPLLDATAPSPAQIESAVRWCRERMADGGVYVHCAAGKGRSAIVVVALLIDLGLATDAESALALIRKSRPSAAPNARQLAALRAWMATRAR